MGKLFDRIRTAVEGDRFVVGWHADEQAEDRAVTPWQIIAGITECELLRERPRSKPNASVVVRQTLANGQEVEVVWSWLSQTGRAKLVTVFFRG